MPAAPTFQPPMNNQMYNNQGPSYGQGHQQYAPPIVSQNQFNSAQNQQQSPPTSNYGPTPNGQAYSNNHYPPQTVSHNPGNSAQNSNSNCAKPHNTGNKMMTVAKVAAGTGLVLAAGAAIAVGVAHMNNKDKHHENDNGYPQQSYPQQNYPQQNYPQQNNNNNNY